MRRSRNGCERSREGRCRPRSLFSGIVSGAIEHPKNIFPARLTRLAAHRAYDKHGTREFCKRHLAVMAEVKSEAERRVIRTTARSVCRGIDACEFIVPEFLY